VVEVAPVVREAPAPEVAADVAGTAEAAPAQARPDAAAALQGQPLQEVIARLLEPVIQQWLEAHLPGMVESRNPRGGGAPIQEAALRAEDLSPSTAEPPRIAAGRAAPFPVRPDLKFHAREDLPARRHRSAYPRGVDEGRSFKAGRPERAQAEPYSIVIPPPNVTGSLHMGHALNNTLQDVLCRFERMRGKDVLWQPGTDHAGIATQLVVERQMMERQEPDRRKIGREKFVEKVWAWKAESGGTIVNQLKRLGASCDWSRERLRWTKVCRAPC
jgi:hypothetical protein